MREIEKKYLIHGHTLDSLSNLISGTLAGLTQDTFTVITGCRTKDTYWTVPALSSLQFIRTRDSVGESTSGEYHILKEITVKAKDQGNNLNRLELNLAIKNVKLANQLLTLLLGTEAVGVISKTEHIWFVHNTGVQGEIVLSVCLIGKDLFLEVEGPTEEIVEEYSELVTRHLGSFTLESQNLFERYIKKSA